MLATSSCKTLPLFGSTDTGSRITVKGSAIHPEHRTPDNAIIGLFCTESHLQVPSTWTSGPPRPNKQGGNFANRRIEKLQTTATTRVQAHSRPVKSVNRSLQSSTAFLFSIFFPLSLKLKDGWSCCFWQIAWFINLLSKSSTGCLINRFQTIETVSMLTTDDSKTWPLLYFMLQVKEPSSKST